MAVLQSYTFKLADGSSWTAQRTLVSPTNIIMGGTILSALDWATLKGRGVTHVLNVEAEHSDAGIVTGAVLLEKPITVTGNPGAAWFAAVTAFYKTVKAAGGTLYIQSQRGVDRAPMALFAILCDQNYDPVSALGLVVSHTNQAGVKFGSMDVHSEMVKNVKSALGKR